MKVKTRLVSATDTDGEYIVVTTETLEQKVPYPYGPIDGHRAAVMQVLGVTAEQIRYVGDHARGYYYEVTAVQ